MPEQASVEWAASPDLPGSWTFWADQSDARYPWGNTSFGGPYILEPPPIGPVQVISFTCNWVLNGWGNAEAVLPVYQEGSLTRADLTRFYGWRLWAMYDGRPVWAGLPTDLEDTGEAAVTMAFTELPGYLERKQHATRVTRTNVEQTTIAAQLAARLENIGVPVVTRPGPGVLRTRSYDYLEGESRAELLQNLQAVGATAETNANGPEFRSEYDVNPASGRPRCTLAICYPRAGSAASGLGVSVPGEGAEFSAKWSGERYRNRTFAVGDLPDTAPDTARRPVEMNYQPEVGIPNIDYVDDYPGVILRATLRERAAAQAAIYRDPALALTATVALSSPPVYSYGVGDDVQVTITDEFMPEGLSLTAVLNEKAADAGEGTSEWIVTTPQPVPRPGRDNLPGRLDAMDSQLQRIWRAGGRIEPLPAGIEE